MICSDITSQLSYREVIKLSVEEARSTKGHKTWAACAQFGASHHHSINMKDDQNTLHKQRQEAKGNTV